MTTRSDPIAISKSNRICTGTRVQRGVFVRFMWQASTGNQYSTRTGMNTGTRYSSLGIPVQSSQRDTCAVGGTDMVGLG